jgi:hypothetical protein
VSAVVRDESNPEHVVDRQIQIGCGLDGEPNGRWRYRWRCSCGKHGPWKTGPRPADSARAAIKGGAEHVEEAARAAKRKRLEPGAR